MSEMVWVTGTVMTMGNGEEALEVIFALREVGLVSILFYSLSRCFMCCSFSFRKLDSLLHVFLFIRRFLQLASVITHTPNADYHPIQTSHMQKASLSPTLKSWGLPPLLVTAPTKRSKSSSNSHYSHSNANSRASSSSKRHGQSASSSSSKTKENANGKGKTMASTTSGSGLGGEGRVSVGDERSEALVRNL